MNHLTGFLDHLLKSAGATVTGANQTNRGSGIGGAINSDFGRGTLTGGALGLLLGKNKKTRKLASYGGLAALGMMVYNTYTEYQRQQAGTAGLPPAQAPALPTPQTVDRLPAAQASAHSAAILQAIVAAAKADGHIDARERGLIEGELARQGLAADVQQWLAPAAGHQLQEHLYLVDPLGNWMMRFPANLDAEGAAKAKKDLERLLRASASWDEPGR